MAYRRLVSARRQVSSSGNYANTSSSSLVRQENFSNSTGVRDYDTRKEDLLEDGLAASGNSGSSMSTVRSKRHADRLEYGWTELIFPPSSGSGSSWESLQHYSTHRALLKYGFDIARGIYPPSHMLHGFQNVLFSRGLSSSSSFKECKVQEMSPSTKGCLSLLTKESSCTDKRLLSCMLGRQFFSSVSTSSNASSYQEADTVTEQSKKPKTLEPSAEDCDQAVEGLSSVKAKARKAQEMQSKGAGVLKKIWIVLLGIGPALRAVAAMSREDWANKLSHWKAEFRDTMKHYWVGTKLLWADIRISLRLLLKLARGTSLTRRERQQLTRTTADIFRLVPFAVFIIVPFMEFLLPVFLKLFPNMLPSTFQDKMKEQEALKRKLNARIEYAKFLQDTVKEMAKEIKTTRSGEVQRTAEDLDQFMNKVRRGEGVSNDDLLGFAKLFNDELTLDNISRPRLVSMCKYMGIKAYGTDAYLRHMLRSKLAWIKNDDRMIQAEGVESLSEAELRAACRDRGMLGLLSVEEMRQQLKDWLDLSLNHSVPSSLLILSRAFTVSGKVRPEEAVQATLSSLPDEVVESVGFTALPSEDALAERMRKLEFLQKEEELIKEERKKEEVEQEKLKAEVAGGDIDHTLQDMKAATARELANQKLSVKQEDLCKLSNALAVLASASSVSKERAEFLRLVNKEIELYNEMVEKEGTEGEAEARRAYQAAHKIREQSAPEAEVSTALVEKIDAMLQNLEKELDDVDARIGDRLKVLDRDSDGKVTPEEVAAAAVFLKDSLGQEPFQELISNLAKDKDGKILVEDIVKLGTIVDKEESTEVSANRRQ